MAKGPANPDKPEAAQAGPNVPNPVTPPQLPNPPVNPKIPHIPLVARSVDPTTEIIHKNMLGAALTLKEPAQGSLSAIAVRRWGELSTELGFGTPRPTKARTGLDPSNQFLFFAPTTSTDPRGTDIRYRRGRAQINLARAFHGLERRSVPPGRREVYDVGITPDKVKFEDGFESISLYIFLTPTKTEPTRTMSEESKAKLRATLQQKKRKKQKDQGASGQA